MNGRTGYAVFLFPQAIEALGDAVKPFLQEGPAGVHVACDEIDTSGPLVMMTMQGRNPVGEPVEMKLMVPVSMVRMVASIQADARFGFGPHTVERTITRLPLPGPEASTPPPLEDAPATPAPAEVPSEAPAETPPAPTPGVPAASPPEAAPETGAATPPPSGNG